MESLATGSPVLAQGRACMLRSCPSSSTTNNLLQLHRPRCSLRPRCVVGVPIQAGIHHGVTLSLSQPCCNIFALALNVKVNAFETSQSLLLMDLDLDPATAKAVIPFLGPFLSAFSFLFIIRIVMSWYPKLPVGKFPYVLVYAPTEPLLGPTRRVIPPLAGVDVAPVVWFGLLSFLNEILLGPQGLLVLLSQQT